MHRFAIKEDGTGRRGRRMFLHFGVPNNPVCWLLGHFPKVKVTYYGRLPDPNVWLECRVCTLRYSEPTKVTDPTRAKEIYEQRKLGMLERPRDFERAARADHAREGFGHHRIELGVELYAYKPTKARLSNLGFRLHSGTRGSETPFDAHLNLGVVAAYFKVGGIGGRFAEWLGRGHKRDISVQIHNGQLWWKLWYDDDGGNDSYHHCDSWRQPKLPPWRWGRRKHRGWMCLWNGNLALNPLSALWGSPKYHYEDVGESRRALVTVGQFPGDEYTVDFTLRRERRHRDHGPRWARRLLSDGYSFNANSRPGIPVRNHDWKGDEILGWGGDLDGWTPDSGENWLPLAVASTVATVKRDREHTGYTPRASVPQ